MAQERKYKCGDTREDGMVFWRYTKAIKSGEYWVTPIKYNENKELMRKKAAHNRSKQNKEEKEAAKKYHQKYYYENRDICLQQKKDYYKKNRDTILAGKKEYHQNNKQKRIETEKQRYAEIKRDPKLYRDHLRKQREYIRERRKTDPLFQLQLCLRALVSNSFHKQGYKKKTKTQEIIGCGFKDLKTHLESLFDHGMSWDNHGFDEGSWQVDHILPLAAAQNKDELISLCHYTNLQPMWATENKSKGDKHCPKELEKYLGKMLEAV